jgi:hypothetical protein
MDTLVGAGRRIVLEVSAKLFGDFSPPAVEDATRHALRAWGPLVDSGDALAILLWLSDGSEILDWGGDDEASVAWASWVGGANREHEPYARDMGDDWYAVPFAATVAPLTYGGIRGLVTAIRETAELMTGRPVQIGATFDPGPEFASSSFKYERHPEITQRNHDAGVGREINMIQATARLKGDDRRYAAFPDGIPEGTSFATFLGRQAASYTQSMGFDYLWLSNGFGFSGYSWTPFGHTFDGRRFWSAKASEIGDDLLVFWDELSAEFSRPIEVRGTNFSAGMDRAVDGVPAAELYRRGYFRACPPNSPWGPLNNDYGLELVGYLSRIASPSLPRFMYRCYVNDPWFWQNPWSDWYGRSSFDIDLPLSLSRLLPDGVQCPTDIAILSIDNERGIVSPRDALEVSTAITSALADAPDAPGPLVWLYPFDEYHAPEAADEAALARTYADDWFTTAIVNAGVPISTVVATEVVVESLAHGHLQDSIVVVPTTALLSGRVQIDALLAGSNGMLLHGSLEALPTDLLARLGMSIAPGLCGDVRVVGTDETLRHDPLTSGGGIAEVLAASAAAEELMAVELEGVRRSYAVVWRDGPSPLVWVRGSSSFEVEQSGDGVVRARVPSNLMSSAAVTRDLLSEFGIHLSYPQLHPSSEVPPGPDPLLMVHRSQGGAWFSGYRVDSTRAVRLGMREGAPLLMNQHAILEGGEATYLLGKSFRHEARVFVRQRSGVAVAREQPPFPSGAARRIVVDGLSDAEVVITPPPERGSALRASVGAADPVHSGVAQPSAVELESDGIRFRATGVTGRLTITW